MIFLFLVILAAIVFLIVGAMLDDRFVSLVRRRVPNFSYEGGTLLMWGALVLAAFSFGLVVAYLLTH